MTTTTTRCDDIHDRYAIDWELCSPPSATTWAQLDTEADAAWFGQWVNPFRRIVLAYCEGELQVKRCHDDRELAVELHRIADWHQKHDRWKGIDPWNDALVRRLDDAGAGDLIHPGRKQPRPSPAPDTPPSDDRQCLTEPQA
ncbi:MAG: hypothetical protein OXH75_10485 [Acidobacteria bacterium]|nr:hypothetical protein [Acidobacteriota bacterium]